MNSKMMGMPLGGVLILIALILGGVLILHIYNIYGSAGNKWYYYGSVGVIGLIGIVLATWSFAKKETERKETKE